MSDRFGVLCATCGKFLDLGPQDQIAYVATYLPELDNNPLACSECGSNHLYTSKDTVDEGGTALNPWPESRLEPQG